MARDAALAGVELAADDAVFAEGPADLLADLADGAVRVELLADGAAGGDNAWVLWGVRWVGQGGKYMGGWRGVGRGMGKGDG